MPSSSRVTVPTLLAQTALLLLFAAMTALFGSARERFLGLIDTLFGRPLITAIQYDPMGRATRYDFANGNNRSWQPVGLETDLLRGADIGPDPPSLSSGTISAAAGVSATTGQIVHNDWGFRQGDRPLIRRCECDR